MTRHPVNRAIRDAEAALFDLYALPPRRGRIRAWIADALSIFAGAVVFVFTTYGLIFLAMAFEGNLQ